MPQVMDIDTPECLTPQIDAEKVVSTSSWETIGESGATSRAESDPAQPNPNIKHALGVNLNLDFTSILSLPSELVYQILSYLSCIDVTTLSATCQYLREHAKDERIWASFVNENLQTPLHDPSPFHSFKSLYISHHPLWFVARNKIWFSDVKNTGKLILARYDHRRGCIEAYRLVARHSFREFQRWPKDPSIYIYTFEPQISLWLDDPVVRLEKFVPTASKPNLGWRKSEIPMPMALEAQRVFSSFILCKKLTARDQINTGNNDDNDNDNNNDISLKRALWPPSVIPSDDRADVTYSEFSTYQNSDDRPSRLDDICESAFRIRRWVQFGNHMAAFDVGTVMDGISTYSSLRPELYTPKREKPYQGIWVGDYSGHGPEFLLVLHRDRDRNASSTEPPEPVAGVRTEGSGGDGSIPTAATPPLAQPNESDSPEISGPLEAIKLTGDPNVPRGQITFLADDIGPRGLVRIADEEIFKGARVVRSRGHVAGPNFRNDKFIPSELILVSHDCIAHYWKELGHISYYRRVDIDQLLEQ